MDTATSPTARHFSDCFIKPKHLVEESKHPIYLSPWDLMHLSTHYMQFGLLFIKHSPFDINAFLESLKHALSVALVHFYPLAGQLVTENNEDGQNCCSIYIDCRKGNGARFIHATLDMTLSDILSPIDVPPVVGSFFDHDGAVSHDGHFRPLLSVQVTDLVDGVFMGCSMNHMVCDGSSYWHFLNLWSEILRAHAKGESISISRPPIHNRWFPEGCGPIFKLPFAHPEKFIGRYQAPQLRERIFHFSSQSLAKLKAKANAEYCNNTTSCSSNRVTMISSFQALSALVWRCVTQASRVHPDQRTFCWLAINDRPRLDPPVTEHYFGNMMFTVRGVTTAGALLERDLGWAAGLLHQAVVAHNSEEVRTVIDAWMHFPIVSHAGSKPPNSYSMRIAGSPRFNVYSNEFTGLGKPFAALGGFGERYDGKVIASPGYEGGGSVNLDICLLPDSMSALELDEEFMAFVSPFHYQMCRI